LPDRFGQLFALDQVGLDLALMPEVIAYRRVNVRESQGGETLGDLLRRGAFLVRADHQVERHARSANANDAELVRGQGYRFGLDLEGHGASLRDNYLHEVGDGGFAEDGAEGAADLAEGGVGADGVEEVGHQVVGAFGGVGEGVEGAPDLGLVAL